MRNLARVAETRAVFQDVGTVVREEGGLFRVQTEQGSFRAARAVSCLVEPRDGDVVLLSCVHPGGCYVLAILERDPGAATCLAVEGDLELRLRGGRLAVAARDGVDVATGGDVSVVAGGLRVHATEGNVFLERLSFLGTFLQAEVAKIKVVAESIDSVADRLWQKVKRAYRKVEESEHVRAGQLDYAAEQNLSLRGENALLTAKALVKVDGDQIHLG